MPDRWFTPHFAWLNCPDRSRSSRSHEVQHIWDVYIREVGFVPYAVREHLFRLCNSPDVDSSWLLWSREAEASLARAYLSAGGPPLSNPGSYVGRGSLSIYTMRLGGRCHDRIHRVDRADEFDVTHSGFFLNSSLAPVLRFRRSFVSVCNVLQGIKPHGFSEGRVAALEHRWQAVVRLGPTGPVTSLDPWTHWIPPDLHGFFLVGYGHFTSSVGIHTLYPSTSTSQSLCALDHSLMHVSLAQVSERLRKSHSYIPLNHASSQFLSHGSGAWCPRHGRYVFRGSSSEHLW